MIGVLANGPDRVIAAEFFELFKTPWEPAVRGRRYEVVLSLGDPVHGVDADLVLIYSSSITPFDRQADAEVTCVQREAVLSWADWSIPVYGGHALFPNADRAGGLLIDGVPAAYGRAAGGQMVWRVGYDLLAEIQRLLADGQPIEHALTPTLDRHIDLMRHLLCRNGVSFVEIPPRPAGFDFICCLTHDIDFCGMRRQPIDRTLAGFAFRASVGSLVDWARGRRSGAEVAANLRSLVSLPLVRAGLQEDFWRPFRDYALAEDRRASTFFLVPFKGQPGVGPDGRVNAARAVAYQASEVRDEACEAAAAGSELGVHGLDAWRDAGAGRRELDEVTSLTGGTSAGVRMHWLYFSPDTPKKLEAAGFAYDSTCGYNEAVGYRAGTAQVFRHPATNDFLELPMTIMDSALFSSSRMALAPDEAMRHCREVLANARLSGGAVVVNWHCRSLAPERLWGRFYRQLLDEIGSPGSVWFATAGDAVNWFRWRRSIRFRSIGADGDEVEVCAAPPVGPGGFVRVHSPGRQRVDVKDYPIDGQQPVPIRLSSVTRHYV